MRLLILSLLLSLCSVTARADQSCVPYLECKPLVTKSVHGPLATHLFWFVRNPTTGGIDHHGFSCPHAACDLQKFQAVANEVLVGKVSPADAWRAQMTFECDYGRWPVPNADDTTVCSERKVALASMRDEWLEGIPRTLSLWKVKSNGLSATRPAFALANGVRSTREVARATVGAPCDISKPKLASGVDVWAEFGNTPGVVALCSKATP